jgi:hypothetical protein
MPASSEPARGDSALVVMVPEAGPVVADLRLRHDRVAAHGVPAHVTVLYPFVPRREVDASVRDALASIFAAIPAFDYRFERVVRLGPATVVLDPVPASAFSQLTDAAHRRWPEHAPYGGVYDVVIPHLTVGDGVDVELVPALESDAQAALEASGPVSGRATAVTLIVADDEAEWSTDSTYALAPADGRIPLRYSPADC